MEDLRPSYAPSSIPLGPGAEVPREMTAADIAEVIDAFSQAAALVKDAGFDGVELHAAHGYLLREFLSPASNIRDDEYGGSVQIRARFPIEVAAAVRDAAGPNLVIGMRLNGEEFVPGGMDIEEACESARILAAGGALDYVSVSAGLSLSGIRRAIPSMYDPPGLYAPMAARIKAATELPTIAAGRITTPALADDIIGSGKADMTAMVRALIADPELPKKALEGREETIRHCVGANECLMRNQRFFAIGCLYNPEAGRELDTRMSRVRKPKKILVVGGGPAGCEAARVAAERGHRVDLWERSHELGGQIRIAANAPGRGDLLQIPAFYRSEMRRLGVGASLGFEATPKVIRESSPDALVLAVGSVPQQPTFSLREVPAISVFEALSGALDPGDNVVVYSEGRHMHGLSVAHYWASRGRAVTILTPHEIIGQDVDPATRETILYELRQLRVRILILHRLRAVDKTELRFEHVVTQETTAVRSFGALIYDYGVRPDSWLEDSLGAAEYEIFPIGDCLTPRNIMGATRDGARVGERI